MLELDSGGTAMKSEVLISQLEFNPFSMIGEEGFLISAAKSSQVALTTASWGLMGFLWGHPVVTVYVRPSRYTCDFLRTTDRFTVSFFPREHSRVLEYCETHRGWDVDKLAGSGLTDERIGDYVVYNEANLTFACRKIYMREMDERLILDKSVADVYYKEKDVHWSFSGQIEHVYI